MDITIHKANTRGHANHGWLDSYHSFSFANYYDPQRMGFGLLRVLNDDKVDGGAGFETHPHDNMEIVSIPLKGALAHQDSTGTKGVIETNDVQIMSAGTGMTHSEYNASKNEEVNFLQIWVFPNERNIPPRYEQKTYLPENRQNKWQTVVAPDQKEALWINQNAWFSLGSFEKGKVAKYEQKKADNGIYLFIIEGSIKLGNEVIQKRDAVAITNADELEIEILDNSELLLIDVPMS